VNPSNPNSLTFQELILRLQAFWAERGCVLQRTCRCFLALLSLLGCLPALMPAAAQSHPADIASAKSITTQDQLNEWMMHYYEHPRPDLTVSAVEFMAKGGELSNKGAQPPMGAFLSQLFAQNTESVAQWQAQLRSGPDDQEKLLALALWMSDSKDSLPLLKSLASGSPGSVGEYAKGLLATRPPDLLRDDVASAGFLDMLWGSFFATGSEKYVQRIISTLPLAKTEGDVQKKLIGAAAQWSLTSNATQHARVMEICEADLKKLPNDQKDALAEVIKRARDQKN